jgi:hypothetical protein
LYRRILSPRRSPEDVKFYDAGEDWTSQRELSSTSSTPSGASHRIQEECLIIKRVHHHNLDVNSPAFREKCLNTCKKSRKQYHDMAKSSYCDNEDDGCCNDGLAIVRRPFIPRAMSGNFLLALPPSTNCPAAFAEMYRSTFNFPSLVSDVVPHILSFCDARTLSRASCVCRSWSVMANADELWTELCKEVFGVAPFELTPPPDPTRILYVMSYLKLRETLSLGSKGVGRGWGLTSGKNNIHVVSASTFRTFGMLSSSEI